MRKILIGACQILMAPITMIVMFAVAVSMVDFINSGPWGMASGFLWSFGMTTFAILFMWAGVKNIICNGE